MSVTVKANPSVPGSLWVLGNSTANLDEALPGWPLFRLAQNAGIVLWISTGPWLGASHLPVGSSLSWPGDQGPDAQIYFTLPRLRASRGELRIHNLEVARASVDLLLVRHEHDVGVKVRREGDVQILVVK